jgi:hypothetical protein
VPGDSSRISGIAFGERAAGRHVEQQNVRAMTANVLPSSIDRPRLGDHLNPTISREHVAQPPANERVVVSDHYPDPIRRRLASGIRRATDGAVGEDARCRQRRHPDRLHIPPNTMPG